MARIIVLTLVLVISGVGLSYGGGFALYEFSARGMALGGFSMGRADDPSALSYNPAGITQLSGKQFQGGTVVYAPMVTVATTNPYTGEKQKTRVKRDYWIAPNLHYTHQLTDRMWLGLGIFSRFGLATEFDDDWPGRYNNQFSRLETYSLNPNLAYRLTDNLSLAAGAEVMRMDVKIDQAIDGSPFFGLPITNNPATRDADIKMKLRGDSWGYGFNLALHYVPSDMFRFGLAYKSPVRQKLRGTARFDSPVDHPVFFRRTDVKGDVTLPDMISAGVAVYPVDSLSLEFAAVYTFWSRYDKMKFNFKDPVLFGESSHSTKKSWRDVWRLQFSVEYSLSPLLDLRASYVFDQTPDPDRRADYLIPTNDRHLFSVGAGLNWEAWTLDMTYSYLLISKRNIKARVEEGVFDSSFSSGRAHFVALSLGYRF